MVAGRIHYYSVDVYINACMSLFNLISVEPQVSLEPRLRDYFLKDTTVVKVVKGGEDVDIFCEAQGFPAPSFRWVKQQK